MKLFTIPNLLTLGNLLCGCLAILFTLDQHQIQWSAILIGIAALLDFFDGFVARALRSSSPIGKELDSLADCITFGVAPGIIVYKIMDTIVHDTATPAGDTVIYLKFLALLIPLFSALRLAKFNIDTRQSDSFIGVPTPANAILISSLSVIFDYISIQLRNEAIPASAILRPIEVGFPIWGIITLKVSTFSFLTTYSFWMGLTFIMSFLLISELPLFALKFKSLGWKGNEIRFVFLIASLSVIVLLGSVGIALTIIMYILLSTLIWLIQLKSRQKVSP